MVARLRLVGEIFAAAVERKRAEALLHAKEQEFRAIVENAPDHIIRYDQEVSADLRQSRIGQGLRSASGSLDRQAHVLGHPGCRAGRQRGRTGADPPTVRGRLRHR